MLLVLVEQVGHREVVQLQAHAAYDASLSPAERELHLVVGFGDEVPSEVNRAVLIVGFDVRLYLFRVEMSH